MESSKFKVIIVGGSVAGLTLALCLARANIDFIVLEKGKEIAPEIGASIGIMPNGGRILDQLGIFDELEQHVEPLDVAHITQPGGFSFDNFYPRILHERFGLPLAFLPRRKFLEIAYDAQPKKQNVLLKKEVVEVRRLHHGVCAVTNDGCVYEGDLIVGADGVHSQIRSEIWKAANENGSKIVTEKEKKSMTVEYACVYGISSRIEGIEAGEQVNALLDGMAVMTLHGKNGRIFWFIFKKLDRRYIYPDVPRFSIDDATELCHTIRHVHLYKGIRVEDIWQRREIIMMTALEEVLFKTWHYDRMVLVGDSVHKMTPNFGQGANCAIEDVAALASLIYDLVTIKDIANPSDHQIHRMLQAYQSARYARMQHIYKDSWALCRIQARASIVYKLINRYYLPYIGNLPAELASKSFAGAAVVGFISLPKRSGPGWVQYSGRKESLVLHYVLAIVFLAFLTQMVVWKI